MINSYINTRENWKNSKLYENTQFLVFPISTRVDITVYQHGKCFKFLKYNSLMVYWIWIKTLYGSRNKITRELDPSLMV